MTDKFVALSKTTKATANPHKIEEIPLNDDVANLTEAELELRKKAIDNMDENLRNIYLSEQEAYKNHRGDIVTFNYDRGLVAADVNRNPSYGSAAIDLLSTALGVDKSTVYKTIRFSTMYNTHDDLNEVLHKAEKNGITLTWSHFATVLHVPETADSTDPHEDRRKMIDLAIENKLSVRALGAQVKLVYGNKTAKKTTTARANVKSLFTKICNSLVRHGVNLKSNVDALLTDFDEAVDTGSAEDIKFYAEKSEALKGCLESIIDLSKRVKDFTDKFPTKINATISEREKSKKSRDDSGSVKAKYSK